MDQIKEAFQKVKKDMIYLDDELSSVKKNLEDMKGEMIRMCGIFEKLSEKLTEKPQKEQEISQDQIKEASTQKLQNQTFSTHVSTHHIALEAPKPPILPVSTGNQGVPTDRQTDRQTDRHMNFEPKIEEKAPKLKISSTRDPIKDASEILASLDSLKKEIRLKFKRLTDQEILVFSTIYQLEEAPDNNINYRAIAKKLGLTESSIRDYVGRLIKKGIPVEKKRINNKNIRLTISEDLKKIASLNTILQLRDL